MENHSTRVPVRGMVAKIKAHKIISGIVAVVVIWVGYTVYGNLTSTTAQPRYVLGTVTKGTIVASVSASGQVSALNQLDLKPKAAGEVTAVYVKAGQTVYAGQALAQIDATTAKQDVADAENSLAQARLQFQKDQSQAPIDYQKSLESLATAKTDLTTTYNDTFNTLSTAYLDLPSAVTGMDNTLHGYDLSPNRSQYNVDYFRNFANNSDSMNLFADVAVRDYATARAKYDQAIIDYKTLTRYSNTTELEKQLGASIDTTTSIAQALQSELNLLDAVIDYGTTYSRPVPTVVNTMRTNTRAYLATANSNLSALLNQQKTLDATKKTIRDNETSITIYKIGNPDGNNPISLQSSQYSIADQERKLAELKDDLANYTITAPFAGTLATFNVKQFDTVSTGTSAASLLTTQKIAALTLNEVDAAKVNVGQKVTLTFDAIEDLTLTGKVAEVDAAGTVSSGVVSYNIKIGFDTQDTRIKSGMTVNASIQTAVKQDVLVVPSSAIKTQNSVSYAQVFSPALAVTGGTQGVVSAVAPQQVEVTTGISDDTNVEILSGLTEGEQIITRTITSKTTTTTTGNTRTNAGGAPGMGALRGL
ncbi:MAG: HlyD family efflux transporter periplasmic adaptor subunit [Candidatus Paceibacterota bacterium]|jgi:HlyD family secretion protein